MFIFVIDEALGFAEPKKSSANEEDNKSWRKQSPSSVEIAIAKLIISAILICLLRAGVEARINRNI